MHYPGRRYPPLDQKPCFHPKWPMKHSPGSTRAEPWAKLSCPFVGAADGYFLWSPPTRRLVEFDTRSGRDRLLQALTSDSTPCVDSVFYGSGSERDPQPIVGHQDYHLPQFVSGFLNDRFFLAAQLGCEMREQKSSHSLGTEKPKEFAR
jgi:hypothetical protein